MLNGLCGINGATVRLRGGPQIHRQHSPLALGPGDSFHVPQWRRITQAFSTLCCPSSNNASKHQINPPPLYPCPSRWKVPEKVLSAPALEIHIAASPRGKEQCRAEIFSARDCKYAAEKCWQLTLFNQPIRIFNSDIITFRILWAESLSCIRLQINVTKSCIIAMLFTMYVLSFRLVASGAWMHPIMLP